MTLPDNQAQNTELGVQVPGATVRQLTHGQDLARVPMWQIRLRLMRRSFGTTWGLFRENRIAAARRWVPVLVALMASVFSMYLITKGLGRVWRAPFYAVVASGLVTLAASYVVAKPWVGKRAHKMENRRKDVSAHNLAA